MNAEELDKKVFKKINCLQLSRRQYSVAVHELQEIGQKLTILCSLLAQDPTRIRMSSDREAVEFSDKENGKEMSICRAEIDALPHQIAGTLLAAREIAHLERCLTDAGFADMIKKAG